jgi:hypothetical protein
LCKSTYLNSEGRGAGENLAEKIVYGLKLEQVLLREILGNPSGIMGISWGNPEEVTLGLSWGNPGGILGVSWGNPGEILGES